MKQLPVLTFTAKKKMLLFSQVILPDIHLLNIRTPFHRTRLKHAVLSNHHGIPIVTRDMTALHQIQPSCVIHQVQPFRLYHTNRFFLRIRCHQHMMLLHLRCPFTHLVRLKTIQAIPRRSRSHHIMHGNPQKLFIPTTDCVFLLDMSV